jgi:hypothetical protein
MKSEMQLYFDGDRLVDFLRHWKHPSESLPERLVALISQLQREGFVKRGDVELARAWVTDLNRIGYKWPSVEIWSQESTDQESAAQAQGGQARMDVHTEWAVSSCEPDRPVFKDTLLVVVMNSPMAYGSVPAFKEIHERSA